MPTLTLMSRLGIVVLAMPLLAQAQLLPRQGETLSEIGAIAVVASVDRDTERLGLDRRLLGEFNWSSQHLDDEVLRCRNGDGEGQTGRVDLRCVRLAGRR